MGPMQDNYVQMLQEFHWHVPNVFNMADVCARRWSKNDHARDRTAIMEHQADGPARRYSFAQLQAAADALSHVLKAQGVKRADRVAIVLPQRFETAVTYMAVMQMGAVAMPLSQLFGPDALSYRLLDSEAVVAIVDDSTVDAVLGIRDQCPLLRCVIGLDDAGHRCDLDYAHVMGSYLQTFDAVSTKAQEAALLIYTSGTTGPPKGALIPHRALIGNLTGFVCSQNWLGFALNKNQTHLENLRPHNPSVFWSPADWAWTGGLMDALLPMLYFGLPIVAFNGRFSPELAFAIMQQHRVTHSFIFPTALKAMMKAYPKPSDHFQLNLQAIMSAGEAVGDAVFAYCKDQLKVTVNEMFGQTEINYIVGNCAMNEKTDQGVGWSAKAGSMGRSYPGHRVAVIDELGIECESGVAGEVALHKRDVHGNPDPIFFLGYWKNQKATQSKFTGDWCRTGDIAIQDSDGYLWYQGRADDVFKSAGYRIGPSEIENCLVKHPAVANSAVVPKPDADRGALVKAYVVLAAGYQASDELIADLQTHVRQLLAPYEYPKEIEFIDALPMTTTGKVMRHILRRQEEERARAK
ncbi:MAG: acyl-CoA synthetase [Burkholderiaceae bacterium]